MIRFRLARFQFWNRPQRAVLLVLLCGLLVYSSIRFALHRGFIDDPPPVESSRAAELADRIDPNTADESTLAALPTLGEKRAKLVVEYRTQHARAGHVVFRDAQDLLSIRGIGVSTLDQIKPFLFFPDVPSTAATSSPTTVPASAQTQG